MKQIPINYYPLLNSGHTLKMAGKIDPWRMYYNKRHYETTSIGIYPDYQVEGIVIPIYGEYLLLKVDGNIDYNVLTSLN